jgi:Uma2 family endonuclease
MAWPGPAGMTYAEFLDWEALHGGRYEYTGGEVYAMTGARRVHNLITGNLFVALREALRGTPCMPYVSDMAVHVQASDAHFYPDVVVSCDPRDAQAERLLEHPRAIAEVLPESTALNDRGHKFAHYRQIPSLQEYLLVDPDTRAVELYRRGESQSWVLYDLTHAPSLTLCGVDLALRVLFADVAAKAAPPAAPGSAEGST